MEEMTTFQKSVLTLLALIAITTCFSAYQLYEIKLASGHGISSFDLELELRPIIRALERMR